VLFIFVKKCNQKNALYGIRAAGSKLSPPRGSRGMPHNANGHETALTRLNGHARSVRPGVSRLIFAGFRPQDVFSFCVGRNGRKRPTV
jgi:hypothetical protein